MSFDVRGVKRGLYERTFPEEKLYKLESCPDKEWGITSPVNQENGWLYQKCLPIPSNDSIDLIPVHEIFKNMNATRGNFFQLVQYRTVHFLNKNTKGQIARSEERILQLTLERFGIQAVNSLLQLRTTMEKQSRFHSPFYAQQLELSFFDTVQNGVWVQCLGIDVFKSEECLKKCLKELFEYFSQKPNERKRTEDALSKILKYLDTCKESHEKERIIEFCYD